MEGRPFVLLGVNNDEDREEIRRVIRQEKLAWRSWWDGPENRIAQQWQVRSWPTLILIDHQGIIRHRNLHGPELDTALEKLVQVAEWDQRYEMLNGAAYQRFDSAR